MDIIKLTKLTHSEALQKAAAVLKRGGLVIYPTETCYGIGADATNQAAIDALLRYKTKRKDKPISVAVTGEEMAGRYVHINNVARNMYQHFLPGPITVVSKGKGKLAAGVESSMGTQGIRVPNHPFILDLVKKYKKPITATSANASYKKTPYTINDVLDNISAKQKKLVSLIIDAGRLPKRKPSTVVDTTLDNIQIVRAGSIKLQNPKTYTANSLDDTKQFVEKLHITLKKSWGNKTIIFLLQGDLGAGKTHFTKFLAEKLSIKELVTSPTFTLCNEYHGKNNGKKITMYHMDTYRMYSPEEVDNLKPEKMFESPHVVVVEWANKIHEYIKPYLKKAVVVQILINAPEETKRVFEYTITR
jgi:L-threonylcarbamoyladenylate synthase